MRKCVREILMGLLLFIPLPASSTLGCGFLSFFFSIIFSSLFAFEPTCFYRTPHCSSHHSSRRGKCRFCRNVLISPSGKGQYVGLCTFITEFGVSPTCPPKKLLRQEPQSPNILEFFNEQIYIYLGKIESTISGEVFGLGLLFCRSREGGRTS